MSIDAASILLGALALGLLSMATRADRSAGRAGPLMINGLRHDESRVVCARRWVNKRTGLLNHAALPVNNGLWLNGTNSVHTRGMLFPIDVVFLGKDSATGRKVLAIHSRVMPNGARLAGPRGTAATLELAAGAALNNFGLSTGHHIALADGAQQ